MSFLAWLPNGLEDELTDGFAHVSVRIAYSLRLALLKERRFVTEASGRLLIGLAASPSGASTSQLVQTNLTRFRYVLQEPPAPGGSRVAKLMLVYYVDEHCPGKYPSYAHSLSGRPC
jgi:hypothetical protein